MVPDVDESVPLHGGEGGEAGPLRDAARRVGDIRALASAALNQTNFFIYYLWFNFQFFSSNEFIIMVLISDGNSK